MNRYYILATHKPEVYTVFYARKDFEWYKKFDPFTYNLLLNNLGDYADLDEAIEWIIYGLRGEYRKFELFG